jgi:hypothetical protein
MEPACVICGAVVSSSRKRMPLPEVGRNFGGLIQPDLQRCVKLNGSNVEECQPRSEAT